MLNSWRTRLTAISAVLAAVLLLAACGNAGGAGREPGGAGVLTAPAVARAEPGDAPVGETVVGLMTLGHNLYTVAADPAENTVISPMSIGFAFGMARAGAGGQTADQLDRVFGFPASGPHTAFNDLEHRIGTVGELPPPAPAATRVSGAPPAPPVVAIANGLFVQDGLPVSEGFLRTLAAQYGAGARLFPAGRGAEQINAWVRERTAARIDRLFDQLDPATRLVLANAVYLKADWRTPFASTLTADAPFTRPDGSTVPVPTMHQQESLRYADGPDWQAVELPYAAGELAMWVIVPRGTATPAELLAPPTLAQVGAGLRPEVVDLALPRWDFGTDLDLLPALRTLGLTSVDDFSGISGAGLRLDQAVHRANITVDEWGTEAAAVTGLAFPTSLPPEPRFAVRADHPFAFAVVHQPTGTPLFIGHVADPLAQ